MTLEDGVCPVCGGPTARTRDTDEGRLYESKDLCRAGCYHDEFAYGASYCRVGDKTWEWHYSENAPSEEIKQAIAEMKKAKGI